MNLLKQLAWKLPVIKQMLNKSNSTQRSKGDIFIALKFKKKTESMGQFGATARTQTNSKTSLFPTQKIYYQNDLDFK